MGDAHFLDYCQLNTAAANVLTLLGQPFLDRDFGPLVSCFSENGFMIVMPFHYGYSGLIPVYAGCKMSTRAN